VNRELPVVAASGRSVPEASNQDATSPIEPIPAAQKRSAELPSVTIARANSVALHVTAHESGVWPESPISACISAPAVTRYAPSVGSLFSAATCSGV
jgi:hypothetical protein